MTLLDPWKTAETDLPVSASPSEKLRFALNYAVLAPSSHNSQPWRFHLVEDGRGVELWADRGRALPVADPQNRELIISCGAALLHLCLAMRYFGPEPRHELFPDPSRPDLVARVVWGEDRRVSKENRILFRNIVWRHTERRRFQDWQVPELLQAELARQAQQEGAWMHFLASRDQREQVAELVAEGARRQFSDSAFRAELASWLRPNWGEAGDGIPGFAMGLGTLASAVGPWFVRNLNCGHLVAERQRQDVLESPAVVVLGTAGDQPLDWVQAGQGLARVLLRACAEGVRASFLNQPVESDELRRRLSRLTGDRGYPQMILRLGYGFSSRPTPRRPVEAVLN